jgi:hypothetical protein
MNKFLSIVILLITISVFYSCNSNTYHPKDENDFKNWVIGEWTGESESRDGRNTFWRKYIFDKDGSYLLLSGSLDNRNYSGNTTLSNDVNDVIKNRNEQESWEILDEDMNGRWIVGKDNFKDSDEEYFYILLKQNGESGSHSILYPKKKLILRNGNLFVNSGLANQFKIEKGDNSPFNFK